MHRRESLRACFRVAFKMYGRWLMRVLRRFLACLFRATHACFMRVVKKLARVLILRYYAFQTQI